MKQHECSACDKSFNSADALAMHNKSKHPETYKKPLLTTKQKRKIRNLAVAFVIIGLLVWGIAVMTSQKSSSTGTLNVDVSSESAQQIPHGAVHWHPILTVLIDGKQIAITADLGY